MPMFGELVSEKRKALGMSQKEVAMKIKKEDGTPISPQYLNDLEHDRRGAPSDFLMRQFSRVLDIPIDVLYYSAGELSPDLRKKNVEESTVEQAYAAFRRVIQKG